jgi:uncharacterized protein
MQHYLHMFTRTFWIDRVERAWERHSLVWLSGVRRVGKTVLCSQLPDIEYFDCELPRTRTMMEDPEGFLAPLAGKRIVLDEVHRLRDPSELLKIAADHFPDVKVIATGSSTLQASAKFRDTLTGRKTGIHLTPMMSQDLRDFGASDLVRRLGHGGLPPFYLPEQVPEVDFQEWMDSYWSKDIQELFRLERRSSFMRFVELILARSGGIFEATKYAAPCEVSRTTIANYLAVLEATNVARVVRPFSTHRPTELTSAPKVYGFDTGFVCYYRGWTQLRPEDLGILWEHYVLNELAARLPGREVRFWRTREHRELDFVLVSRGKPPVAIECKWTADGKEDLPGLRSFRRAYPQGESFVVASDVSRRFEREIAGSLVRYVALDDLVSTLAGDEAQGD